MKKLMKFVIPALLFFLMLAPGKMLAMRHGGGEDDRWSRMDYDYAFDPARFAQFKSLMEQLGCADNVFGDAGAAMKEVASSSASAALESTASYSEEVVGFARPVAALKLRGEEGPCACLRWWRRGYSRVPVERSLDELKGDFEKECLRRLNGARRWTIQGTMAEEASFLGCMCLATQCLKEKDKHEGAGQSTGTSFGVLNCVFNSAFVLRDMLKSVYALWYPQLNTLAELEERYAVEQCFIPRSLWDAIKMKFKLARANPLGQLEPIAFLNFALDFTSLRNKQEVVIDQKSQQTPSSALVAESERPTLLLAKDVLSKPEAVLALLLEVKAMLRGSLDQYETMEKSEFDGLVASVFMFVSKLVYDEGEVLPQFLVGPWGIGKTHFFSVLTDWLQKKFPDSIYCEKIKVEKPAELEGSPSEPGIFLTILRKQLSSRCRGAVIFLDEAMWLNSGGMLESAKRTFSDENFSEIMTYYFGTRIAIPFKMMPLLVLVASNDEITDSPLKSRFGIVHFPLPTRKALTAFAKKHFRESPLYRAAQAPDPAMKDMIIAIEKALEDRFMADDAPQNFREVKAETDKLVVALLTAEKKPVETPSAQEVKKLVCLALKGRGLVSDDAVAEKTKKES